MNENENNNHFAEVDTLVQKWAPLLDEDVSGGAVKDNYKRKVTAKILENQEIAMEKTDTALLETTNTGAVANWNPVLISLVRRAMPNLIAYDVCGVQPMSGPTGLIFAMKSKYQSTKNGVTAGDEALFQEPIASYTGDSTTVAQGGTTGLESGVSDTDNDSDIADSAGLPTTANPYATADGELLGVSGHDQGFAEMGFSIEKATVTAKTRALKAEYTLEMAQDLKAIHGLDAESELANLLSTEVLAEINREIVRTINAQAKIGSRQTTNETLGIFDINSDADGRWMIERYKALVYQIEREANVIAKETRRGKGNIIMCSSDVASAFVVTKMLSYTPEMKAALNVDDTGNTFVGVLNNRYKVFIDPYASRDYINVGYKGTNPYDAGLFYCPYVPLTMVKAVGEEDFQPRIGFKTRYGVAVNPFVDPTNISDRDGLVNSDSTTTTRKNQYYRISAINNIMA